MSKCGFMRSQVLGCRPNRLSNMQQGTEPGPLWEALPPDCLSGLLNQDPLPAQSTGQSPQTLLLICHCPSFQSRAHTLSRTTHLTSPVYAPLPFTQQFCAETAILLFSFCCTSGMWVKTGATTTSAGQRRAAVARA